MKIKIPDFTNQSEITHFVKVATNIIDNEHKENEQIDPETKKKIGQVCSPSIAFNDAGQSVMDALSQHTKHLQSKISSGKLISKTELENSKTLERLAIMASSNPNSDKFKHRMDKLNKGESTGVGFATSHARWKSIEISAERAGLLEGSTFRPKVSITASHHAR